MDTVTLKLTREEAYALYEAVTPTIDSESAIFARKLRSALCESLLPTLDKLQLLTVKVASSSVGHPDMYGLISFNTEGLCGYSLFFNGLKEFDVKCVSYDADDEHIVVKDTNGDYHTFYRSMATMPDDWKAYLTAH